MRWWNILFERAKTHLVPEELKDALIENLAARGCEAVRPTIVQSGGICRGGARLADESWMTFQLPGLEFKLYATDVDSYLIELGTLGERFELGRHYYKLHGDLHVVCLLPEHKESLERQLTERFAEAVAIADIDNARMNRRMAELSRSPYISAPHAPRIGRPIRGEN